MLSQLDIVAQAYEILKNEADLKYDDLMKAYSKLKEAKFLPIYSKQSTDQMLGQAERCSNAYP